MKSLYPPVQNTYERKTEQLQNPAHVDLHRLKSYPTNLVIIFMWVLVVAALLGLLEATANHASSVVKQPWYYDWLPSIILTLFTQAHGPITAAFNARIAVSALKSRHAPKTWAELFYTTDGNWSSPLGMLKSLYSTSFRVSFVYYLFILHTILAIAAPLLLSRAYPFQTIAVASPTNLLLNTFYSPNIESVQLDLQLAIGTGGAVTGLPILEVYNSSAYVPRGTSRYSPPSEMFFAGDTQQTDTQLDGLHIQGSCERVQGLADPIDPSVFIAMCNQLSTQVPWAGFIATTEDSVVVNTSSCASKPPFGGFMDNSTTSFTTAYMWISAHNGTDAQDGVTVAGVAMCNATFTTARAKVYGLEGAFDTLEPIAIYNESAAQGGEPLAHPLTAALVALGNSDSTAPQAHVAILSMWSYTINPNASVTNYDQPTMETMIDQIWSATLYMTGSIGIASQQAGQAHDVIKHTMVSGRVRENMWADAAWATLGLWLLLVIYSSVFLFRPAIGDSLSSYVAARLLAEQPQLVKGQECGTLKDNENMRRPFSQVVAHDSNAFDGISD